MDIKCRCCLTTKKGVYHSLLGLFQHEKNSSSLLDILRIVTSTQVTLSNNLPGEICQVCLKSLKNAFRFITVFKNSQKSLQQSIDKNAEGGENEDIFDCIEQIVIETKDEGCAEANIEGFFVNCNAKDEPVKEEDASAVESIEQADYKYLPSDDETSCISLPPEDVKDFDVTVKVEEVKVKQEELLEMEKNREKNMNNVTMMNIDDVLKVRKRKVSEKKVVLSVEDVVNIQKKRPPKDQIGAVHICDVCQRVFTSLRNLSHHKYSLHNPNWKEKFKCARCGTQCKTVSGLTHHMLKHSGKKHGCHLCDKEYLVKQHLIVHIKTKHDDSYQNKYLCPFCGRGFKSSGSLTYHLRIHNNQRNYMCRFCGFKSLTLSGMKRHERVHTGERPYNCRYCNKSFAGTPERQKHEHIHKGIRPFKCQYCDKRFVQQYNMKVHMLQHDGDNACDFCGKSFVDENTLKFHYHRRHKEMFGDDENLDGQSE